MKKTNCTKIKRYANRAKYIKNKLLTIAIIGTLICTLLLTLGCGDTLDGEDNSEGEASAIVSVKVIDL